MLHDLRYATRTLRRSPGFTLTVVLTLALGVGANTAMFSVIYTVMLRPLPYPDPGRLVMLWERDAQKGVEQGLVTPANFVDWRAQSRAFDAMGFSPAWSGSRWFNLAGKDGNERVRGAYVSSGFFAAMGVQPALGRGFVAAEDDPKSNPVAVVSHGLWQRRFGADPKVVSGQSVEVDSYNSRRYTIVGVMPPGFQFPEQAEIWLPAGYMGVKVPPPGSSDRCCPWLQVVARLKPGVTLDQARSEMSTIARRITAQYPGARFSSEVKVVPLHEQLVGPARQALLVLLGAVVFVLLIACANVANLLLARAAAHRPELEIRAALGAGRARLLLHLLADSLLLALLGGAAGLGVALAASRFVPAVNLNPTVLFFTLALSVATALFSGLLPALTATRPRVSVSPRPRVSTSRLLVVSEMALALMLLSGAGLLLRSFLKLQAVDPGFRPQHVMAAAIDLSSTAFSDRRRRKAMFRDLMDRARAWPGVVSVGGVSLLPLSGGQAGQPITLEGHPFVAGADSPRVLAEGATPDYFRTLGIPLLRGRFFTEADDMEAPEVVIINETMARRYWPGENPLGRRLVFGSRERVARSRAPAGPDDLPWLMIVGVVADTRAAGLAAGPRPEMYMPYWQWPWHWAELVVRTTGDPGSLATAIRTELRTLAPNAVITRMATMEQVVAESVSGPRRRALLLGLFAALALALAAVGLYGTMSYSVTERTHEIGIRMALGAQREDVLRLVLRQAAALAAAGIAIGLGGALVLTRILATQLYAIRPTDPATFVAISLLLAGVALGAAYWPARRAAKVDPMVALRHS